VPDLLVRWIILTGGGGDSHDPTTNEQVVAPKKSLNQLQTVIDRAGGKINLNTRFYSYEQSKK
jgi:hypothetical protein